MGGNLFRGKGEITNRRLVNTTVQGCCQSNIVGNDQIILAYLLIELVDSLYSLHDNLECETANKASSVMIVIRVISVIVSFSIPLSQLSLMDDVYVVEAAMTGPKGFPIDRVVQVAVCCMHKDGTDFDTVYDSFVYAEPMDLGKDSLDYMQEEFSITAGTLYLAPSEDVIAKELLEKLRDCECTSFNVNRTFGQFLCVEPWDLNGEITLLPSISSRLPPEYSRDLTEAYNYVTPGNPMNVEGKTAMDRCLMSTSIMMKLRETGYF